MITWWPTLCDCPESHEQEMTRRANRFMHRPTEDYLRRTMPVKCDCDYTCSTALDDADFARAIMAHLNRRVDR